MRKGLLCRLTPQPVLLLLLAQLASADFIRYYPPAGGSGTFTGGTLTGAVEGVTGCAAPSYSFTDDTNAGVCLVAANQTRLQTAPVSTASSSSVLLTAAAASLEFWDAGSAVSGVYATDDQTAFYTNGTERGAFSTTEFVTRLPLRVGLTSAYDPLILSPAVLGAGSFSGTITSADLTGASIWKFPNGSATVCAAGTGLCAVTGDGTTAAREIAAGTGISVANGPGTAGNPTVSLDTTVVGLFSSDTASPPATCTIGEEYEETDLAKSCKCVATNTWQCDYGTNTGDVTLAGTPDYITISNQVITRGSVDLAADVTGDLPLSNVAQASAASRLLGRGSAGGAGDFQEITLGSGLSMSGTELTASGSGFDPLDVDTVWFREEFGVGASGTNVQVGGLGWGVGTLTGGGVGRALGAFPNLGLHVCNTATAASSGAEIFLGVNTAEILGALASNANWDSYFVFQISHSTEILFRVGFVATESSFGSPVGAFGVKVSTDASDTTYKLCVYSGGSDTCFDTTVSLDTSFHKLRIRSTSVGTILMTFDAGAEKSFCPSSCDVTVTPGTDSMTPQFLIRADADGVAVARSLSADFFAFKATVNR